MCKYGREDTRHVGKYIAARILQRLLTLFALAVFIFVIVRLTGDPIDLLTTVDASPQEREHIAKVMGLDKSYIEQFGVYLLRLVRGDFGTSFVLRRPAMEVFLERLPNTVSLAAVSMSFALLLGILLGVISATRRGTVIDTATKIIAALGVATPNFWLGLILILFLSVRFKIFPVGGMGTPAHYLLPALTLGSFFVAGISRLLRSSMLEVLGSGFIVFARAKGCSEQSIIWKHALRNALIPVTTFAGMYFAILITGSIAVETVFNWPGVGRLAYEAVRGRDFPLIQACVLLEGAIITTMNLAVDIVYAYIDPRIGRASQA